MVTEEEMAEGQDTAVMAREEVMAEGTEITGDTGEEKKEVKEDIGEKEAKAEKDIMVTEVLEIGQEEAIREDIE